MKNKTLHQNNSMSQEPTNMQTFVHTEKSPHIPVLLQNVLQTFDKILNTKNPDYLPYSHYKKHKLHQIAQQENLPLHIQNPQIIDCTLGFGGMSSALLESYPNLHIIGIDRDSEAIAYNARLQEKFQKRFQSIQGSFAQILPDFLQTDFKKQLVGILADIGVSSYQLDTPHRGFSFDSENLDMRMDTTQDLNADFILNHYNKMQLERIFREYGEIREYKKLVYSILQEREKGRITHTILKNIALKLSTKGKIHPATLLYQALRIEVNDELGQLRKLLCACKNLKNIVLCIISFHSLEDRIIKETFKKWSSNCICPENSLKCECGNNHAKGIILYKKPLSANAKELQTNKRARSAKLRAFYFFT